MKIIDIINISESRRKKNRGSPVPKPKPRASPSTSSPPAPSGPPANRAERIARRDMLRARKQIKDAATFLAKTAEDVAFMKRMKPLRLTAVSGFKTTARIIRYFQIWGYYEMYEQYKEDKATLQALHDLPEDDPDYEFGRLTDAELAYYQRMLMEETALKIGLSAAFPAAIRGILQICGAVRLAILVTSTAATGIPTGGFGPLATFAATEAGMLALQYYMTTEQGKDTVKWLLMSLFDPAVQYAWPKGPQQFFAFLFQQAKDEVELPPKPPGRDVNLNNLKTDIKPGQGQQPEKNQAQSPATNTQDRVNFDQLDKL